MSTWPKDELRKIAENDDLHISPFREDGKTYGTPTSIWSVAVDGSLYVGMPHGVELKGEELFYTHIHLHGGPAPVRRYLPKLIDLVLNRKIDPGKVFDLTLPLEQVAEGYRAMDERRAIKTLLRP